MLLMISHGWPGSVAEFFDLIEPLALSERFGGNVEDTFIVIAPSLPGFGFSGRPPRPYAPPQGGVGYKLPYDQCLGIRLLPLPREGVEVNFSKLRAIRNLCMARSRHRNGR